MQREALQEAIVTYTDKIFQKACCSFLPPNQVSTALRPRPGADPSDPLPVLFGFHQHFGWVPELLDVSPQSDRYWMLREATLEVVNT